LHRFFAGLCSKRPVRFYIIQYCSYGITKAMVVLLCTLMFADAANEILSGYRDVEISSISCVI